METRKFKRDEYLLASLRAPILRMAAAALDAPAASFVLLDEDGVLSLREQLGAGHTQAALAVAAEAARAAIAGRAAVAVSGGGAAPYAVAAPVAERPNEQAAIVVVRSTLPFAAGECDRLLSMAISASQVLTQGRAMADAQCAAEDLHDIMSSLTDAVLVVDRRRRLTYLNPAAERVLRIASGDVVRRDVRQAGIAGLDEDVWAALDRVFAEGVPPPLERRIGGSLYSLDISPSPAGAQIMLHDITRERQTDALREGLISNVSHELRTPLASIKGYATTLLRKDVTWDASTQREFIEIIDEESDRLRELIDSLLDMSKIEAGVLPIERLPVQIARIAKQTAAELKGKSDRHTISVDFGSGFPLVESDPRRIAQVLRNLIENAIKYSPAGGRVTVEGRLVEAGDTQYRLSAPPAPPLVLVSVSDEGSGMPQKDQERLFERFYRGSGENKRVSGSGLGLYICRGIIEAHGGRIWVDSALGKGTRVTFALPVS